MRLLFILAAMLWAYRDDVEGGCEATCAKQLIVVVAEVVQAKGWNLKSAPVWTAKGSSAFKAMHDNTLT